MINSYFDLMGFFLITLRHGVLTPRTESTAFSQLTQIRNDTGYLCQLFPIGIRIDLEMGDASEESLGVWMLGIAHNLPHRTFFELMAENSEVGQGVIRVLCQRLRAGIESQNKK